METARGHDDEVMMIATRKTIEVDGAGLGDDDDDER
jgi:hypothetical protein